MSLDGHVSWGSDYWRKADIVADQPEADWFSSYWEYGEYDSPLSRLEQRVGIVCRDGATYAKADAAGFEDVWYRKEGPEFNEYSFYLEWSDSQLGLEDEDVDLILVTI